MFQFGFIAGAVFLADLLTKSIVRAQMPLYSEIKLLPFFSLSHLDNTGIAFGFFQDKNLFFLIAGALVVVFIIFLGIRFLPSDPFSAYVLAGVSGGALGNLLDRALRGHVTDFLDFYIGQHHWPAFNVADSAVCVGACLLLWRSFSSKSEARNPKSEENSNV